MLNVLKSFVNAFSAYSCIPLPYYEDEGDRYRLAFVPLVGAIIYGASYVWFLLGWYRHFNDVAVSFGIILIATIVTGGRHVLGFVAYVDDIPTYKYRFDSWSKSRDRGVLRFLVVMSIWFIAMLNTYDFYFRLVFLGFIFSRIFMGLLSSLFNEGANQSKAVIVLLIIEFCILTYAGFNEYELLMAGPILATFITFLCYINAFRRSTEEALCLLEDDYIITAETAWIFSVAIVCLIRSV